MSATAPSSHVRGTSRTGGEDARRDLLVVLAGFGALTAEAFAALQGTSPPSARGRLAAAERAGLTRSWRLLRDEPTLHTVTAAGLRASGCTGLSPVRIGPGGAGHAIATAAAASGLARAFPDVALLGEPAIRRLERERGRPLAMLAGRRGHRPDLLLLPSDRPSPVGDRTLPVAIEVELTLKAPDRLAAICRAWARSREVSGAIYLAAPPVLEPLTRAIAAAGAQSRVVALPLDAFGSAIAGDA